MTEEMKDKYVTGIANALNIDKKEIQDGETVRKWQNRMGEFLEDPIKFYKASIERRQKLIEKAQLRIERHQKKIETLKKLIERKQAKHDPQ